MNIPEALEIRDEFWEKSRPSEEDVFAFTEALEYLIRETKQPEYMINLGGYYYEQKRFDLALKYYEMAAAHDSVHALICLGYIWYYGRTGTRDYEKAFHYFTAGKNAGDLQSAYKIADMHKNGYYVEKDYEEYRRIIEELYPKAKEAKSLEDPLPEIYTRLARIRIEQGRCDEAKDLLVTARDFLAQRICYHPFFGNLNIMKWLVEDLYKLPADPVPADFDLFSLYEVLKKPVTVKCRYGKDELEIVSVMEDGECVIRFGDQWFRNTDDFFAGAVWNETPLTAVYDLLYDWEVQDGDC